MTLAIDMGNSDILLGVFDDGGHLIASSRTSSLRYKSVDEYVGTIRELLFLKGIDPGSVTGSILSSVVPQLTAVIVSAIHRLTGKRPLILSSGVKTGLAVRVDNPAEVGNDLIADCVGAVKKYGSPCIVIDLGTASKICMIDKNGDFVGCVIMPGVRTATAALVTKASELPSVACVAPAHVIGKNTADSMNSGIVYGHASMIDGFISRFWEEEGYRSRIVATGGLVNNIIPYCQTPGIVTDKFVILEGLYEIFLRNEEDRLRKEARKHEKQ